MVIYSIKDIEEITGIKAHTLRIWEKRYNIIVPQRTETNIRYYTEKELKEILNISFLNKNGWKISHIAKLSEPQIKTEVSRLTQLDDQVDKQLDALSIAVINLDDKTVNIILNKYINKFGFEKAMDIVINPFIEKLSVLWMAGSVKSVHESFISEILKHKTIQAIQNIDTEQDSDFKVLLYLNEGEKQELSILFLMYLLRIKGIRAKLIGFDISMVDLLDAYQIVKPEFIYTIVNEDFEENSFGAYIEYISKTIAPCKFLISGIQAFNSTQKFPENCVLVNDMESAVQYLTNGNQRRANTA